MSDANITLEKFLDKAAITLNETEDNLAELARIALLKYEQSLPDQENGHGPLDPETSRHLRRVGQQLLKLSEQSKVLHNCLESGLETPPPSDDYWPRIRILQSQEEERTQIARELEDLVGQLLANTIFELASTRHLLAGGHESVTEGLDALQTELEQGLADVRHFIATLEPATILSNFGLGGGLRRYLERYEAKTGINTHLRINANVGRLPSLVESSIFRIVQEALNNVQHHADATQVEIIIEEEDSDLKFSIIDDGGGIASEKFGTSRKNLGLARMVDYAELLNGKFRILSEPDQGTRVILTVPYPEL